jgi:1-acyl-sn-glycerol-3-phosphate acyltransferase
VRGTEHLPEGGALILANHQSFLDPLLVGVSLRRPVTFLARDNLFRVPVIGWILRNTYVMPIRREATSTESLREALRRIDLGYLVGLFPEGTRTRTGQLGVLKPGFLALVRRANCPVVPVGISGAFESFPRGAVLPRPGHVRVVFGEAISTSSLQQFQGREGQTALVQEIARRLANCLAEAEAWRADH